MSTFRRRLMMAAAKSAHPYFPSDTPDAIRNSCILWYDIEKQGATNESMSVDPTLIDLTGNGYNATCYNFSWSDMSGVGGYAYDFTSFNQNLLSNCTANKFDLTNPDTGYGGTYKQKEWFNQKFTLRITNFNSEVSLIIRYYYTDEDGINQMSGAIEEITSNGDYIIDGSLYPEATGIAIQFRGQGSCTIEQLPLYPNALVSDGVDDYCLVEGLPLLNKEDGYTVIAKRKWIEIPTQTSALSSKRDVDNSIDGAFQFEYTTQNRQIEMNFGTDTSISFIQENISWATSQQYNNISLKIGKGEDSDIMQLFRSIPNGVCVKIAIYSFLLFNRDLTAEEIDWVKTNLIEGDYKFE